MCMSYVQCFTCVHYSSMVYASVSVAIPTSVTDAEINIKSSF